MEKSWANYHGHSFYCDGQGVPEDYVLKAIELGMNTIGVSSHAPVPFTTDWNMLSEKLPVYIKDLADLKVKYKNQINLLSAMEVDYIPSVAGPHHPRIPNASLDYTVGSVHFVDAFEDDAPFSIDDATPKFVKGMDEIFGGDIRKIIKRYFDLQKEMLEKDPPKILGHPDKIRMHNRNRFFFDETADWYLEEVRSTLKLAAEKEVIVEINTKYFEAAEYTFPSSTHFKWMAQNKIPVTLNSDAHKPENLLSGFMEVAELLLENNIKHLWQYNNQAGDFVPKNFEKDGIEW
ncbi:histidinol-phosphatase (PHP family) [Marinilabilia salmonicolor]|jgi:histidinol-phosphatase (PHP family)|uniref:histidinol-phosphatase n=1 Tax=Marinilabilia salmonicolor TaxID=989 RepID=UPI000D0724DC|nr:histidinol-phosphatase [Marinilabilia salmonicolor]PRZ00030.1 histidinol-phosphatase (PHP family) [Marinilabilia salmonicolor]